MKYSIETASRFDAESARRTARETGRLADKLEEIFPNTPLSEFEVRPAKADLINPKPSMAYRKREDGGHFIVEHAYYCSHCRGWVRGARREEPFNTLAPLSGAEGFKYNCTVCQEEVGYLILAKA